MNSKHLLQLGDASCVVVGESLTYSELQFLELKKGELHLSVPTSASAAQL